MGAEEKRKKLHVTLCAKETENNELFVGRTHWCFRLVPTIPVTGVVIVETIAFFLLIVMGLPVCCIL